MRIRFYILQDQISSVGDVIVNSLVYNIENNTQKFIQVPENGGKISTVSVAADRATMALAEASAVKPTISVFELSTFRKRKTIVAESSVNNVFRTVFISRNSSLSHSRPMEDI
jgi:hypothetical protein